MCSSEYPEYSGILYVIKCDTIKPMIIQIISLFPEVFLPYLNTSMIHKATTNKAVEFRFINLRDFGIGMRRRVDDTPYGGGDGMLLKPEPLVSAIEAAKQNVDSDKVKIILPTPRGKLYRQSDANRLAGQLDGLIIVCPRYEGYDERVINWVDEQICIGQYVLTGGELPALVIVDSIVRLLPGVLGGEKSAEIESFQKDDHSIEFPQYTRPADFRGLKVPEVLLSGHHARVDGWREENRTV